MLNSRPRVAKQEAISQWAMTLKRRLRAMIPYPGEVDGQEALAGRPDGEGAGLEHGDAVEVLLASSRALPSLGQCVLDLRRVSAISTSLFFGTRPLFRSFASHNHPSHS